MFPKRFSKRIMLHCPNCKTDVPLMKPVTVKVDVVLEIIMGMICFVGGMLFYYYFFVLNFR